MISFYHTKALKALSLIFILGIVQADSSGTCVTTEQGVCLPKSMVSNRRYAEAIESDSSHCSFAGTIVLGGPSSMEPGEKYFNLAKKQLASMSLVVDFVNKYQCGISISSGNYSIDILTYDDESSTDLTTNIAEKLVSNNQVNALLGGYSSGLTGPLAEVVNKSTSHLLVAPGAASTGVFNDRDGVFGILPPTAKYTSQAIEGLANLGAKTIATVWEDASFTRGACGAIPDLADIYNLNITSTQEVVNAPNVSVLTTVAEKLATESPDVVVTCVYDEGCVNWMKAMRNTGWSPKAQVFTICVGLNDFTQQIGTDANYIMGVTPWDSSLNIQDQVTGWSAEDFAGIYQSATSDTDITYHTAAAAAAISVIIQAIKQADAISETKAIRDIIASGTFQTMYGEVSFDNNGQSRAPSLLIQYDTNGTVQSVFPAEVSSGPILYPMPSFSQRDCMHLSDCEVSGDGTCNSNGECVCKNQEDFNSEGEGEDALCSHKEPDNVVYVTQGTNPVLSIVLPIALALVVVVVVFLFYEHNRKQNDSVWKVKREELTFDDPPELIGRGTFGVVILGEYRGTQVAVKRVIPSKKSKKSKRTGSEPGTSSGYSSDGYASTDGYLSSSDRYLSSDDGDANKNRVDMTGGFGAKSWGIGALSTGGGVFTKSKAATAMTSIIGNMSRGKPTESPEEPMSRKQLKKDFMEEMRHLSKLRHPCVTTVMGAVVDEDPMLVMEYMDHGSLFDLLHNETMILEGETLLPILRDISQGVRFLHSAEPQVIHGDLKAQNILVDSKLHAKVADFGLSQKKKKNLRGTGTPFWMAPELLRGESSNNAATDVYSFGIILYEAFSRRVPYDGEDPREVLPLVADRAVRKRPLPPRGMPAPVLSLMNDCLQDEPDKRPTFEELDIRLKRVDAENVDAGLGVKKAAISLFDIFPRHIAEALRDGRTVDSEHHELVTIFFSDIIGFTKISSELPPKKVADMLDRLYTKFDELSRQHDVFKVETIGDAYMVASNLVKDQTADHVKIVAQFAIDAIKAANETYIDLEDHSMGIVNIRVGLHSGSVVTDVVGTRNPRYCLFGDTVNTASRMESNAKTNRIHCSSVSAELLKQQCPGMPLKSRGLVAIKGKGDMHTFWVNEHGDSRSRQVPASERDMLEWAKSSSKTFSKPEQHPYTFDPEIGKGRGGLTIGAKDQGPFPNKTTKPDLVLPEGWEYIWSDTQQKWYYWNTKTGKSAWKPPRAKAVAAAPS